MRWERVFLPVLPNLTNDCCHQPTMPCGGQDAQYVCECSRPSEEGEDRGQIHSKEARRDPMQVHIHPSTVALYGDKQKHKNTHTRHAVYVHDSMPCHLQHRPRIGTCGRKRVHDRAAFTASISIKKAEAKDRGGHAYTDARTSNPIPSDFPDEYRPPQNDTFDVGVDVNGQTHDFPALRGWSWVGCSLYGHGYSMTKGGQ